MDKIAFLFIMLIIGQVVKHFIAPKVGFPYTTLVTIVATLMGAFISSGRFYDAM